MSDPEFISRYNTPLDVEADREFSDWLLRNSQRQNRDVAKDMVDYDLRGWWSENSGRDLDGAHLTDRYKKPNHPTFSNESKYHGVNGWEGGRWEDAGNGRWRFHAGRGNLVLRTPEDLADYFRTREPDTELVLPKTFKQRWQDLGPVGEPTFNQRWKETEGVNFPANPGNMLNIEKQLQERGYRTLMDRERRKRAPQPTALV